VSVLEAKTELTTIASKTIQHPMVTIDSNARLLIPILPIDLRSFIVRVLNELFVDPVAPIVASPNLTS
jgi:hypothetical protein